MTITSAANVAARSRSKTAPAWRRRRPSASSQARRRGRRAMLAALEGSGKALIITSGVAMLAPDQIATEAHDAARHGRGETEGMVRDAASGGLKTAVIRLPPITHQDGDGGFLGPLVGTAKAKGKSVYIGDGANRWPAGNRADAAVLYRFVPGRFASLVRRSGFPK
jgi:hypothetical protein